MSGYEIRLMYYEEGVDWAEDGDEEDEHHGREEDSTQESRHETQSDLKNLTGQCGTVYAQILS